MLSKPYSYFKLLGLIFSLFITTLVYFAWLKFPKYVLSIEHSFPNQEESIVIYDDLDSDNCSEKITFYKKFANVPSILLERQEKPLSQETLKGELAYGKILVGDYNRDGVRELYFTTIDNDSVFLNVLEPLEFRYLFKRLFITKALRLNGELDFVVADMQLVSTADSIKQDLYVLIGCAFTHVNRAILCVDLATGFIHRTPTIGSNMLAPLWINDYNGDGKLEIFCQYMATGNTPLSYPYSDSISWVMAFNDTLGFLFKPINLGDHPATIGCCPINDGSSECIASFQFHSGDSDSSLYSLVNLNGEVLFQRAVKTTVQHREPALLVPGERGTFNVLYGSGELVCYDRWFNVRNKSTVLPYLLPLVQRPVDINNDGKKEWLFRGKEFNEIVVTESNFSHPVSLFLEQPILRDFYFSLKQTVNGSSITFLSTSQRFYELEYKVNPLYYIRFLFALIVFCFVFFGMFGIADYYKRYVERRHNIEKELASLQLQSIERNHLNGHFTLNIINSIGALYEKQELPKAQYYFGKYSKLLTQSLMWSGRTTIAIAEELDFVSSYLELEQLRANGGFSYSVVNQGAEEGFIPKFLVHNFVENAVKHGVKPLLGSKELRIDVIAKKKGSCVEIFVADNGVGYKNSAKQSNSKSTGQGIRIVSEMVSLYKAVSGVDISYSILDNEVVGTTVKIVIGCPR